MLVFFSRGKGRRKTGVLLFLSHMLQLKKKRGQVILWAYTCIRFNLEPLELFDVFYFSLSLFEFLFGYLASNGGELNNHT